MTAPSDPKPGEAPPADIVDLHDGHDAASAPTRPSLDLDLDLPPRADADGDAGLGQREANSPGPAAAAIPPATSSLAPALQLEALPPTPGAWPLWQRLAFRYALCHVVLYTLPFLFVAWLSLVASGVQYLAWKLDLPSLREGVWAWPARAAAELSGWFAARWSQVTLWMDANHLAPYEVIQQRTGSGDTGHGFARLLCIVAASVLITGIWSALQRRPVGYPRVGRWLHLYTRWYVALVVLGYGIGKVYGGQFGELRPDRLLQPIGETPPMQMVGTFMQASRPYELLGAIGEIVGPLLLLHHRTALLGAVVTAVVMANVCALNWLCGVPVKISSTHLLLFSCGLMAPYAGRLVALFVTNRPSDPVDLRVVHRRWLVWLLALFGTSWIACHLVDTHFTRSRALASRQPKPALFGVWRVERMLLDGVEVPATDAARWMNVLVQPWPTLEIRDLAERKHVFGLTEKLADGQLVLRPMGGGEPLTWTIVMGTKKTPEWNPVPLRNQDRSKPVEVDRRTMVMTGTWSGKAIEVHTVQRGFPLQTPFRLRQELPDFW